MQRHNNPFSPLWINCVLSSDGYEMRRLDMRMPNLPHRNVRKGRSISYILSWKGKEGWCADARLGCGYDSLIIDVGGLYLPDRELCRGGNLVWCYPTPLLERCF